MREINFRAWDGKKMRRVLSVEWLDEVYVTYWDNQGVATADAILMQYTGLKDKNGKDIYEGDVIELDEHVENVIVVWRNDNAAFACRQINETTPYSWDMFGATLCKVVGNIYEHPHLLNNEK